MAPTKQLRIPPTKRGRHTREHIIETAAALMFTNGVERTTIDDVTGAAGVGKSQIYHYFTGKSHLVRAVIERQTDYVLDPHGPHLAPLDTWTAWVTWRNTLVAFQAETGCIGGCPLGSLASELSDTDISARVALIDSFDRWQQVFETGLKTMRETGQLAATTDVARLGCSILAALQGGLLLCQIRKDTTPLEAALDGALTQLASQLTTAR